MALITHLLHSATAYFFPTEGQPRPFSEFPATVFGEYISQYSELTLSKEDCAKDCVKHVQSCLKSADYDLSTPSRQVIDTHLEQFNHIADATPYMTPYDANQLKAEYRRQLGVAIGEKWTQLMVESFSCCLSLTDPTEWVNSVKQWVYRYFVGLEYLQKCHDIHEPKLTQEFVTKMAWKAAYALLLYSKEESQKNTQTTQRLYDQNPIGFIRSLMSFGLREQTSSWVFQEQVRERIELLKQWILAGYIAQEKGESIFDIQISS